MIKIKFYDTGLKDKKSGFLNYIDESVKNSVILVLVKKFFCYLARLISESFVFSAFYNISMAIADFFSKLFIVRFFCYEFDDKTVLGKSFIGFVTHKFSFMKEKIKAFKRSFARIYEKSFIVSLIEAKFKKFPAHRLKSIGLFLLFFGMSCSLILCLKYFSGFKSSGMSAFDSRVLWQPFVGLLSLELMFSLLTVVFGIILIPSKKTVGEGICESVFLRFCFFKLLFLDENSYLIPPESVKSRSGVFSILGIVFGIIGSVVNPVLVIGAFVVLEAVYIIMTKPECGVIILFFTLPFLPTMMLAGIVILSFISFALKYVRGKRIIKFDIFDILITLFCIIIFLGGLFSAGKLSSIPPSLMYICFLMSYFLIKNLLSTKELIYRCVSLALFSGMLVSIYGVYQYFFTSANSKWIDTNMFTDIKSRVVSTFDNPNVLGEYLIMIIPIVIGMTIVAKNAHLKLPCLMVLALSGGCLIFTWSRGAWLGFIFSAIIFFLILDKKTVMAFTLGIFALPFLPVLLPQSIVSRFTSIGNLTDSSTSYRFFIWVGTMVMLRDYGVGGIGLGEGAFRSVYPAYALSAIEKAPHSHSLFMQLCVEMGVFAVIFYVAMLVVYSQKCISFAVNNKKADRFSSLLVTGCFAGVCAISVQGFTDYTWYNYRVFLMFWMIFSLSIAAIHVSKAERMSGERYSVSKLNYNY